MSIMRAFAKGYLGGELDKFQAMAERQVKEDDRKAKLADDIERARKQAEIDAEFEELKLDKEAKRRKMDLMSLGFKSEFIDQHAGYALSSDTNFKNYLDMGKEIYGLTNWWKTPTNHGGNIGQTIQEIAMNSSGNTQNFNTQSAVNTVKNENNISDNVAGSQFDITPTTGGSVSKDKVQYIGSELFYGKKKQKIGEGKRFISSTGETVDAFQISQTPGEEDFGSIYYVPTIDGNVPVSRYFNNVSYFSTDSEKGKSFIEQYNPTLKEQKDLKFLVDMGEGNLQYVSGRRDTLTDGSFNDVITYIPKNIVTKTNLMLNQYIPSQAEGVPGEGNMTDPEFKHYEMPVKNFKIFMEDKGISVASFGDTKDSLAMAAQELGVVTAPRELKIINRNRIKAENIAVASGFDYSQKQLNYNEFTEGYDLSLFGNTTEDKIKQNVFTILSDPLLDNWQNRTVSDEVNNALGINGNEEGVTASTFATAIGKSINNISSNIRGYYKDLVKDMDEDQFANFKKRAGVNTVMGEDLTKENIDQFALQQLSEVQSFEDLINFNTRINEDKQSRLDDSVNTAIGNLPGANGNTSTGMDIIDGVIMETMSQDGNKDLLQVELLNLIGNQATVQLINDNYVAEKLANLDTSTLPEKSILQTDMDRKETTQTLEDMDKEVWLRTDSVDPIPTIPSEAAEWRQQNASDPNVLNFFGGQGSLYDENTGFQIFKSPDLKPGHVEPRPKGEGVASKTPKNWDLLYAKTHNADGIPKTQE